MPLEEEQNLITLYYTYYIVINKQTFGM